MCLLVFLFAACYIPRILRRGSSALTNYYFLSPVLLQDLYKMKTINLLHKRISDSVIVRYFGRLFR